MPVTVAIAGEFNAAFPPHPATDDALRHAADALGLDLDANWISTSAVDDRVVRDHHGLLVAPGSPYRDIARTLQAIRCAREQHIPCLGTCGGFQHMIIEYARNVLGISGAGHAEYDPYTSNLFVTRLECSLAGRDLHLRFTPGSFVATCYGGQRALESYYCNFGIDPDKVAALNAGPLRIVGEDDEGAVRVIELPGHPFFVGTLFVPQLRSTPGAPHPLVTAFLRAAAHAPR
jgi:CTP synthase (UTP-ammonia lyase)